MKEEEKSLQQAIDILNKKYGDNSVFNLTEEYNESIKTVSTGLPSLDMILGGGIPEGRIIEIFGMEACQPKGSKVFMADGSFKNVENISIGDIVISPQRNGTNLYSKVLHTTKWISPKIFELLSTRNNEVYYKCSGNHIIPFESYPQRKMANSRKAMTFRTLSELTAKELSLLKEATTRYSIFTNGCIKRFLNRKNSSFPAYSLGVLLGDGSLSEKDINVSSMDKVIIEHLKNEGGKFYAPVIDKRGNKAKMYRLVKNHIWFKSLKEQKLLGTNSHTKFIPDVAKYSDNNYRRNLLAGLMDTDGSLIKKETLRGSGKLRLSYYDYSTVSYKLAQDVKFLVYSLGGYCIISERETSAVKNGKKFKSYRLYISLDSSLPVQCDRKKTVLNDKMKRNPKMHGFRIVEKEGEEVYGFILDSSSQWYITDNFFVTHNSGKTTLALQILAQCQKAFSEKKVAFIDVENALDPEYAKKIGINLSKMFISQPNSGEEALDIAEKLAQSNMISCIVVDSVSNLVPQAVAAKEIDGTANIGTTARLMSQTLPRLSNAIRKSNTILIFINQIRMKIGVMWGNPETVTGGLALKFNASQRIEIRGRKAEERNGREGIPVKITIKKNKIAPPFRQTETFLIFGEGFSVIDDVIETAVAKDIIQKSGGWFVYGQIKTHGINELREHILNDEKIKNKLLQEVNKK